MKLGTYVREVYAKQKRSHRSSNTGVLDNQPDGTYLSLSVHAGEYMSPPASPSYTVQINALGKATDLMYTLKRCKTGICRGARVAHPSTCSAAGMDRADVRASAFNSLLRLHPTSCMLLAMLPMLPSQRRVDKDKGSHRQMGNPTVY